jgi:hypothetical protein
MLIHIEMKRKTKQTKCNETNGKGFLVFGPGFWLGFGKLPRTQDLTPKTLFRLFRHFSFISSFYSLLSFLWFYKLSLT